MRKTTGWTKYQPFGGQVNYYHECGLVLWSRETPNRYEARWEDAVWEVIYPTLEECKRVALQGVLQLVDEELERLLEQRNALNIVLGQAS